MELVDENEGYYDEEVVDFLSGEALPEFSLSSQPLAVQSSASTRARLYDEQIGLEEQPSATSLPE